MAPVSQAREQDVEERLATEREPLDHEPVLDAEAGGS
jgi:hypothetical protein